MSAAPDFAEHEAMRPDIPAAPKSDAKPAVVMPWKIWTPDEIYAELPAIDWLVDGIIPRATVGMLAAYGSSLKSWGELDMLTTLATGSPWLGRFGCKRCNALLIDYESGSYELRRRLQRIARGYGLTGPVDGLGFVTMPPNFINDAAWIEIVAKLAQSYGLIAIDTLAAGTNGTDENDARFAGPLNLLKPIAETTGCSFLALHHTRKSRENDDDRETTRGTSAIYNALDFELKLFRAKGEDGLYLCKQTKARYGKAVAPFGVRVVDDESGHGSAVLAIDPPGEDDDDGALESATSAIERAKQKIVALLAKEHDLRSANEVHRRVRGTKKVNLDALTELEERKLVIRHDGALRLASEVTP